MPLKRKLRPVPENLKRMRYGLEDLGERKWLAKFYGTIDTMTGELKSFAFGVKISKRVSTDRRALAALIRATVQKLRENTVPEHESGEVFSDFLSLFGRDWQRVRRIREYHAGVIYGR
jgi:hypothetical protein